MGKESIITEEERQEIFLDALRKNWGIVKRASESSGISANSHYVWMKKYEHYREKVATVEDDMLDEVEDIAYQHIRSLDPKTIQLIMFVLRTKGRKRGYQENAEKVHSTKSGEPIVFRINGQDLNIGK